MFFIIISCDPALGKSKANAFHSFAAAAWNALSVTENGVGGVGDKLGRVGWGETG